MGGHRKGKPLTAMISLLSPDDDRRFASVARIFAAAIEPSEQKPLEVLRRHIGDERYGFLIAEDGGEVVGFAAVFIPSSRDFWLLEYLAVDGARRSAGLGAALFDAAIAHADNVVPGCFGLLEVDAADAVVGEGNDIPRRLQFYARNGCRKIAGLRYLLPLSSRGAPPAMQLLVHGRSDQSTIARSTLQQWLVALYREVYDQPGGDPRLARMTALLPDTIELQEIGAPAAG
jgi:GNAT superfamily N-acetyltransferase